MSVCIPDNLSSCVCSCASSLEFENDPDANQRRNGTGPNKNATYFSGHDLSSLYSLLRRWMTAVLVICSSGALAGGQMKRKKQEKGTQWADDSQKKRDAGNVQLSFPFFPVNLVEINIILHSLHSSCKINSLFPLLFLLFSHLQYSASQKKVPKKINCCLYNKWS